MAVYSGMLFIVKLKQMRWYQNSDYPVIVNEGRQNVKYGQI